MMTRDRWAMGLATERCADGTDRGSPRKRHCFNSPRRASPASHAGRHAPLRRRPPRRLAAPGAERLPAAGTGVPPLTV
jgi:hypothetical protein